MEAIRQQWVLDIQWSDAPEEVYKEARQLWKDQDMLRNDVCFWKFQDDDWYEAREGTYPYPAIAKLILESAIPEDEEVWIHWWW